MLRSPIGRRPPTCYPPAMDRADAAGRLAELREAIRHHDDAYYVEARPEVADSEYDALRRELSDLEAAFPELITPDSPTQRVAGQPVDTFRPVENKVAMRSLDNATTPEDLREFEARLNRALPGTGFRYVCEPKIDGLGVALLYQDGRFVRGATRGDGRVGEEITQNLRTIRSLPMTLRGRLATIGEVEVRGEVFMPRAEFEKLNRSLEDAGDTTFANPRNAAAGAVRQKDPATTARRPLDIFLYHVSEARELGFTTYAETLEALRAAGFKVNPRTEPCPTLDAVVTYCERLEAERDGLGYDADGAVIKVDSLEQQWRLGSTTHHPRWALAFKFAARQATTVVQSIDVHVGKTGTLTPVAKLEPVELAGVTIRNVSLHNEDEIRRKDIRVGDTVLIERAGDVIPYVVQVIAGKRPPDSKELERLADKSAHNLVTAIEGSKTRGLAPLLNALGIRMVGERVAGVLASHFGSMSRVQEVSVAELTEIRGIGEEIAESVRKFFDDESNAEVIRRLGVAGVAMSQPGFQADAPRPLAGQTFVLTGTLQSLTRDAARERIERLGGRVTSSVSKKTSYVVVGEAAGSKADDARRLGVTILDEATLLELLQRR